MTSVFRFLAVVICLAFHWATTLSALQAKDLSWLTPGPHVPDVELIDHTGQPFQLKTLIDTRLLIVSFFFAGCASICPPQTAILQQVRDHLRAHPQPDTAFPLILSIAVDPSDPAKVREYAGQFGIELGRDQGWLMLTGKFDRLLRVAAAFDEVGNSPQEHTGTIWIGNPIAQRWLRIPFSSPEAASASAIELLLREAGR